MGILRDAVRSYQDLIVWQKAIDLVVEVYALTRLFPRDERYGLVTQLNRAAVSVPANIAEGHARASGKECAHFLSVARGSLSEVETYLILAARLGMIDSETFDRILANAAEVGRMLHALRQRIIQRTDGNATS